MKVWLETIAGWFFLALWIVVPVAIGASFALFILPMIEVYGYMQGWWTP
jgi:hypothetical protein